MITGGVLVIVVLAAVVIVVGCPAVNDVVINCDVDIMPDIGMIAVVIAGV